MELRSIGTIAHALVLSMGHARRFGILIPKFNLSVIVSIMILSTLCVPGTSGRGSPSLGDSTQGQIVFAGGDGSASNPYQISNVTQLQNMSSNLSAHYVLINDINASNTSTWNGGSGFDPVGVYYDRFIGSLDGRNHTISNLTIERTDSYIGLFEYVGSGGKVENVGLYNIKVSGNGNVGGLVGYNHGGTIRNCYATGNVSGYSKIGGLVGLNYYGTVKNCYATGNVSGNNSIGGLVGYNDGTVENCYATGNVSGYGRIGGLVGNNRRTVKICYATGNVSGEGSIGGLAGFNSGTVENSFYNINITKINGTNRLTPYGIYAEQFNDWFNNNKGICLA